VIHGCEAQLRVGMKGVYGLDFGAIFQVARAQGLGASPLLADVLPDVERLAVRAFQSPEDSDHGD